MSQWSNLPTEILEIVFSYVGAYEFTRTQYLPQCALTCRRWKLPAQKVHFKIKSIIKEEDIYKAKTILSTKDGLNLGVFVKELYYGCAGNDNKEETFRLELLDEIFPRLEKIDYDSHNDNSIPIFKMIASGKFQWLKELPIPNTNSCDQLYVKCAQMLKNRLKYIYLSQYLISGRIGTYQYLYDQLNQFSCLESISANIFSVSTQTVWDYMESILSTRAHGPLKKVCLHISAQSNNFILSQKINQITPSYNLKDLKLSYKGIILNADINILYFMKKFPNLNSLQIPYKRWLENPSNFTFPSPPSSTMVSQFLNYIHNLPDRSEVDSIIIDEENAHEIISQFFNNIKSDPADKERITICIHHLHVDWLKKTHSSRPAMVDISTGTKKNSITRIEFSFKNGEDSTKLSYLDLIEKAGSHFHEGLFLDYPRVQPNTTLLDHVVKYCVNLRSLDISGGKDLGDYSQPATVTSNSLTTLILRGYTLTAEFCSFIEQRLPNLHSMRIGNCFGFPVPELSVPLYFRNTAFKVLEIDTTLNPDHLNYNNISIRVKIAEAKNHCYYRLNRTKPNTEDEDITCAYKIDRRLYTKDQFELDLEDGNCLIYDIICKSVKELYIDYVSENGETACLSVFHE